MHTQSSLSTEYVRVPVSASVDGAPINPISDVVTMAFPVAGNTPTTWYSASWETDNTTTPPTLYVKCLVGPSPGLVTLTPNTLFDVYTKIVDNPESPARNTGGLWVY